MIYCFREQQTVVEIDEAKEELAGVRSEMAKVSLALNHCHNLHDVKTIRRT
jgi:ribosomal protein L29